MARKIQFRRGTAASWTSTDPTLAIGELGLETDTGKMKIGDGVTAWSARPYIDAAAVAHIAASAGAHAAAAIANTPAGTIAATTVQGALNELDTEKAPLASPALTGTPTAPTAATATNTTQVATTAFVRANRAEQAAADLSQYRPFAGALTLYDNFGTTGVLNGQTTPWGRTYAVGQRLEHDRDRARRGVGRQALEGHVGCRLLQLRGVGRPRTDQHERVVRRRLDGARFCRHGYVADHW